MKKRIYSAITLQGLFLIMSYTFNSCTKEETLTNPIVETIQVTSVTVATAICGGTITSNGGATITVSGVCWSTTANPTTANSKTTNGATSGTFTSSLTGLVSGTTYYVRAYATNSVGTAYGNQQTFTTSTSIPSLTTSNITAVSATTATCGGTITSNGGAIITVSGVCWSTSENPTTANSKTTNGATSGSFTSSLTGLVSGTTYYVRAYATNRIGTAYGNQQTFNSTSSIPTLTTSNITAVTATTATCGGTITSNGGTTITVSGVCWSTSENPTTANSKTTDGLSASIFTSSLTGLVSGTTYYVRAYATNSVGTAYGNQQTFTTSTSIPSLTTSNITAVTATTATCGGTITSNGGATITVSGVCWSTSENPTTANSKTTDGSTSGSFTSSLTGLLSVTTYYVRAYATNSVGTAYGNQQTFNSTTSIPSLTTSNVTSVTATTATCGGTITSNGGATITVSGLCWSKSATPTTTNYKTIDGSTSGSFASSLTGLLSGTTYYVRAYATNSVGTGYGNEVSFKTYVAIDRDGNGYTTVTIGTQVWMVENLKTTKYNDGTSIPLVTDGTAWTNLRTPGYCFYNNDAANKTTYGALYNWYTVNTGKLAPTGWHVPTDAEWTTLVYYMMMNGYNYDGEPDDLYNDIAKSLAATTLWHISTRVGAIGNDLTKNNKSGFSGLPGGCRDGDGPFNYISTYGYWWSSTQNNPFANAWYRDLCFNESNIKRDIHYLQCGYSVRCIRDF